MKGKQKNNHKQRWIDNDTFSEKCRCIVFIVGMSYSAHHLVVFSLSYCLYIVFHATRKVYSDSKDSLCNEWTPVGCNNSWPCPSPSRIWLNQTFFCDVSSAELFLGMLDTVFLFSYAVGMYFTSALADRVELRLMISVGMLFSGILLFFFGILPDWLDYYGKALYAVLWSLQGITQSVGWPCCVAALGNWFGKSKRGLLFGLWGSCASVGNIVGNAIAGGLLPYGYIYAFLTVMMLMIGGAVVTFFGFINSPIEIGLPEPPEDSDSVGENILSEDTTEEQNCSEELESSHPDKVVNPECPEKSEVLSFKDALCLPGVIPYALSFACLKFVNYAFLFWLPFYLVNHLHWSDSFASNVSTWYDIGGIIGGICCGIITDILGNRSSVLFVMLFLAPFSLWGYKASPPNITVNCTLMALAGFFINGVSNILSTAIAIDLAKQQSSKGNKKALATVTGIIDATGSLGAAIGQYGIAAIQVQKGWGWVFNLFIIAVVTASIFIIPVLYRDFKNCSLPNLLKRGRYMPINNDKHS